MASMKKLLNDRHGEWKGRSYRVTMTRIVPLIAEKYLVDP